jgi:hypothetical protein
VRAAEAASKAAARGDKDSGDGFFDDWGHVPGSPSSSSSSHTPAAAASSAASPAARTERPSSSSGSAPTSVHTAHAHAPAPAPSPADAEGGASESSLEPPPLPSFLQHKDPLRGIHLHASSSSFPTEKHGNAHAAGEGKEDEGRDVHGAHAEDKEKATHDRPRDRIDKMIALQVCLSFSV